MAYLEYMFEAYRHGFREVNMTEGTLRFLIDYLSLFRAGRFSVYQIYSAMRSEGDPMAYKNVHQKVHKLLSLGLIQDLKEGYVLHGAKYYQISLNGWVNLILKSKTPYLVEVIREYYDKNIIFKTFLYQYFELETIVLFLNPFEVDTYLRNCCQTTVQTMNMWESSGSKEEPVLGLPRGKLRHLSDEKLRNALKYKLDIRNTYRHVSHYTLTSKKEEMGSLFTGFPTGRSITEELDLHVKSFLFGQILRASYVPYFESALAEDRKFMAALIKIGEEFNQIYDKLIDLRKINK
jgi:hypothetical protein